MKKYFNIILIALAFALGMGFNTFSISAAPSNIAVVDLNAVVGQSAQVLTLKKEQALKMDDLQKWLVTARADVEKQKTQEGKEKLAQKYDAEFIKKQTAIQKDYTARLQVIDKNISDVITKEAKKNGYEIVLAKGVVLYGGHDITNTISKQVK